MNTAITVVATSFRSEKYLERFLCNIAVCEPRELLKCLIILNEPSCAEMQILLKHAGESPGLFEHIVIDKREPISVSLNRGFRQASSDYVCYADVDDIREPNSFLRLWQALQFDRQADFAYGDFVVVSAQGKTQGELVRAPRFHRRMFTRGSYVGPTHFYRRDLFGKIGYWDEQLRSGGDYEFQARAAAAGVRFCKTSGVSVYYTREEQSASASSGLLQPVERTVVELRYGATDKIDVRFLEQAKKYRLWEIQEGQSLYHISKVVPGHESFVRSNGRRPSPEILLEARRRFVRFLS